MYKLTNYNILNSKENTENMFRLNIHNEKTNLNFFCENTIERNKWIDYFN